MSSFCRLELTCRDAKEADKIARSLLEKKLVACARQIPISSAYRYQGKIEEAQEILLMMETKTNLFETIEKTVAELHSYDTFVLAQIAVDKISGKAGQWLTEEIL